MFENIYLNKKILITGHTGFKGAWLTLWLSTIGAKVYGVARNPDFEQSLYRQLKLNDVTDSIQGDIMDRDNIHKVTREIKPDFIFHLAAQPIVSNAFVDPISTFNINCIGTANVLEASRKLNNQCVIVIVSTDKCYANKEKEWSYREDDRMGGKDPYSASKSIVEIITKSYYSSFFSNPDSNIKIGSVRSGNLIGGGDWSRDRIIPDFVSAINSNKAIDLKSPHTTRPWQHVLDSLNGYLKTGQYLATNAELNGEAFNFGPNEVDHTVLDLINEFAGYWDHSTLSKPYYIIPEDVQCPKDTSALNLNCEKAHRILNWKPLLGFTESVNYTANWYNDYYKDDKAALELTKSQIQDFSNLINQTESSILGK